MKLKLTAREVMFHSVEIDTDDYLSGDEDKKSVFKIAELINRIKCDPIRFANDEKEQMTQRHDAEWHDVELIEINN